MAGAGSRREARTTIATSQHGVDNITMSPTPIAQLRARVGSLTARDLAHEIVDRGWEEMPSRRGKGSHRRFGKAGQRPITLPIRPAKGTVLAILKRLEAEEADHG